MSHETSVPAHGISRDARPIVSIGMPAYNAEATIAAAIDSLLRQTYPHFELIISDNASSDRTWSIIEDYARRDDRIVALRQPHNVGANGNYSAVFRAARGQYFKWASSNDWCAPSFLEQCVAHLDAHRETVLVSPRTRLFEGSIERFSDYPHDVAFDESDAVERFVKVGRALMLNNVLNGLMRSKVLAQTRLIDHFPGADNVLVGHLALLGRIVLLDEPLFYRRMDDGTATRLMSSEALHRHHYPVKTLRSLFPAWRFMGGLLRTAVSSGLTVGDTMRALRVVLRETYWRKAYLRRDVVNALHQMVGR